MCINNLSIHFNDPGKIVFDQRKVLPSDKFKFVYEVLHNDISMMVPSTQNLSGYDEVTDKLR